MSEVGESIIRGLKEALAYVQGEPVDVIVHHARVPDAVDVKAIRNGLGMTQREFAGRFGFSLGTLRNWERGHRRPEGSARAFLTVIAKRPEAVIEALGNGNQPT
jgi:putative transcriptional regulator